MITKLIPKNIKTWLKRKIAGATNPPRDVELYKYCPYRQGSDSFLIPKSSDSVVECCSQGLAIPPRELWAGYGSTNEEYLSSGKDHVNTMLELVEGSSFSFTAGDAILDFGCAGGRMIRYLKNLSESCEVWGTDIQAERIYWCKQYLTPPFHFAVTTKIPHLPFKDGYFKFIYAGSVFTHIPDLAKAWLLELRRVISPNGRLYLTIHDNHTIKLLDSSFKDNWFAKRMETSDLYVKSKHNFGMLVIDRNRACQVFYDIDYFCKTLSPMYKILSITKEAYGYQTAVLVKPK